MIALIMTALFKNIAINRIIVILLKCSMYNLKSSKGEKKRGYNFKGFHDRKSFYFYVFLYIFYHRNWKLSL